MKTHVYIPQYGVVRLLVSLGKVLTFFSFCCLTSSGHVEI